jgi:acyl-CoA thioesterase
MAKDRVEKVKRLINEKDTLISLFNMTIVELKSGSSVVSMKVGKDHVNAAGYCHGGVIFSLADVSFALACNSHGKLAVAMDMSISFIKAVSPGTEITARCNERHRGKSTGRYTIEVMDNENNLVALLKATAFRIGTQIV